MEATFCEELIKLMKKHGVKKMSGGTLTPYEDIQINGVTFDFDPTEEKLKKPGIWNNKEKVKKALERRKNIGALHTKLLSNIKAKLPELEKLLEEINGHWNLIDGVYRFFHKSFKVYYLQGITLKIVKALKSLAPDDYDLNNDFMSIVKDGTGKVFDVSHNRDWARHTRPIVEACFHARYFLEMCVKSAKEIDEAPHCLPSNWALTLYLYELR